MQQPLNHRLNLTLCLLILYLLAKDNPKPCLCRQELYHSDVVLVLETEWQDQHSFRLKILLTYFACILIEHLLLNSLDTHLQVILHRVLVHQFFREVQNSITNRSVENV